MSVSDALNFVLGIHGAVLVLVIAAFYRYGDRTEVLDRSLKGAEEVLEKIRKQLADELGESLSEILEDTADIAVSFESYTELRGNPVGSEAYKNCMQEFVETALNTMIDCRAMRTARDSWCFWARILSWSIVSLLIWEVVALGILGALDKLVGIPMSERLVDLSLLPTAAGVFVAIGTLPLLLKHHDVINEFKVKYNGP